MNKWLFSLLLCLAVTPAAADTLEISFNDFSAQAGYRFGLMQDDYGRSVIDSSLLYNEKEETLLGSLGLDFVGEPGNVPGLDLGVGARVYGGGTDHSRDLLALAVGVGAEYFPPALGGFGMAAELFFAPRIFSFLDADRLFEGGIRLAYAVTPRVRVHLGYQNIRTDFEEGGDTSIDEAVRVGFTARF